MDILILLITIVGLIVVERLPLTRFEPLPVARPYAGSDVVYLLTSGIGLSLLAQELALRFVGPAGTFSAGAAVLACSIVLFDLGSYVAHRLLHRVDFLWEVHKVHHSSRKLDWLATFRGHLIEHGLRQLFSPVLLIILGVPLTIVGLTAALHGAWSVWAHSNFGPRLKFLDAFVVTPRLHRVHHVATTCERNFGVMFTIWDRLAGTLSKPTEAGGVIGVPDEIDTYPQTWAKQLIEPFRRRRAPAVVAASEVSS